jgi:hypothetical protein
MPGTQRVECCPPDTDGILGTPHDCSNAGEVRQDFTVYPG